MTAETNQCGIHGEIVLCLNVVKKGIDKLGIKHDSDVKDLHNKLDDGFKCRISNTMLIFILAIFSASGLFLFDISRASCGANTMLIKENTMSIDGMRADILKELKEIKKAVEVQR